ncbi:MAG: S8 family peptidase, partial [Dongiaceae bacterium]
MERPDHLRPAPRVLFESLEDRLALAVDAAANFWIDEHVLDVAIEQHDRQIVPHDDFGAAGHWSSAPASAAASTTFTGRGQTVAIIDSGIAYDHVALGGGFGSGYRVVGGWDFAENDADPYDDGPAGFHGTHVAGIIAAAGGGRAGLASGVDLVALRVFDDAGNGYFSWVEQSLQWVHSRRNSFANPITTVNLSLGSQWNAATAPNWATLEDELRQLELDGIFVTVSAGNSFQQYGSTGLSYPAASQYVVPVASVDAAGNLSRFSQRDSRVLAAPGERITSTVPDHYFGGDGIKNDWDAASGTSMAAPYVAAASVLVRQALRAVAQTVVTPDGI